MNAIEKCSSADIPPPLEQRAERIRSLVTTTRTCIIEIGRELIAAKAEAPHGRWLPWLEREFGWSDQTANRYMQVADAFKSLTVRDLAGINLTATAQYVLAAPEVLPEVRTEAVTRAKAGETITKKAAVEAAKQGEMFVREALQSKLADLTGRVEAYAEERAAPFWKNCLDCSVEELDRVIARRLSAIEGRRIELHKIELLRETAFKRGCEPHAPISSVLGGYAASKTRAYQSAGDAA